MRTATIDRLLGIALVLGVTFTIGRWRWATEVLRHGDVQPIALALVPRIGVQSITPPDSAFESLMDRDPFRLSGRPSHVRHGEEQSAVRTATPPYRPALSLKAIVGGPPWSALIGGIPGRSGVVVLGPGDRADSITVRSITRERVTLDGPDTSWVLTLRSGRP